MRIKLVVSAVMLSASAVAAQGSRAPDAEAAPGGATASKKPYTRLFAAKPESKPTRDTARIVCGMLMLPTDPNLDLQIRKTAPSESGAAIRRIQPPVCTGLTPQTRPLR